MAYSEQTTNYGLPLPTGTDKSTWLDTNEGFQAVDTALAGAVAQGGTNEAAIEALTTRMVAAEGGISQNATDIDTLETRMTANEQVAGNALTGVAQLSEKVYEYEERTFTDAPTLFNVLQDMNEREITQVFIKSLTTAAGIRKEARNGTVTSSATTSATKARYMRILSRGENSIIFKDVRPEYNIANNYMIVSITTESLSIKNNAMENVETVIWTEDGNLTFTAGTSADVTNVALLIPVAVSDD